MCPVSVGTTVKTNYWIDVRQAVVSLPCFFCLCPASALLHIISLYFVFHSVCFSATLRRKIKRFLLWHCIKSLTCRYTVRFEQVVPHCWPLLNHWPSTFHCSCVLSFFFFFLPPTVSESIKVDLIHSSLSIKKNAWTQWYFTLHNMWMYCVSEIFKLRIWGLFLTLLVCFYLNETLHIYLKSKEKDIHYLALWPLTMSNSFCSPLDSVWYVNNYNAFYCLHACSGDKSPSQLKGIEGNKDTGYCTLWWYNLVRAVVNSKRLLSVARVVT